MSRNLSTLLKEYISEFVEEHQDHIVDLHGTCISEMERILIEVIMTHTEGNQVQAAKLLGLNRNTLRRKIIEYKMESILPKAS